MPLYWYLYVWREAPAAGSPAPSALRSTVSIQPALSKHRMKKLRKKRLLLCCVIYLSCFVFAAAIVFASAQDLTPKSAAESKYKVGQVWSYKTRSGEEKSYFIVLRVEDDAKLGKIVHIAVRGLRMKNPRSPDGISDEVNHMPFSEEAINKSALTLLKVKTDLPDYEEGYQMWREAFDAGNAGIYTITLAEAVRVMEATLKQH